MGDGAREQVAGPRAAWAIAPGVLLVGVAGGIAFPILPLVGLRAGLSLPFIGMIMAANRFARVFSSPVVGVLADRIGGRRLLLLGLVLQVAVMGLFWAGIVAGRPGLFFLLARLLHGPGSACVLVSAQVLALQAGGRTRGGASVGVVGAAMMIGMPAGLVVGGLLAGRWGERITFEAAIAVTALATAAAALTVPDLRAGAVKVPRLIHTIRGLADRRLAALGALNFATFFSAQGVVLTTIVLLLKIRGLSMSTLGDQGTAALMMGVVVLAGGGASIASGYFGDKLHSYAWIAGVGFLPLVAGLALTAWASSAAGLAAAMALVGAGMGASSAALLALVSLFVAPDRRGSAVGAIQLLGDVGGTLGPILGAALFAHSTRTPFVASAAVCAAAIPAAAWLARAERTATRQPAAGRETAARGAS